MVSLLFILVTLGVLMFVVMAGAMILLDPIICILAIVLLYKLIKKIFGKGKKKKG